MKRNETEIGPTGFLIAFMGLPGSGKTSSARELAMLIAGAKAYLEPEESDWPAAVMDRHRVGAFTALTWFRSMRVPLLVSASADRNSGRTAIVDSYYDKLIAKYISHPPMRWLIATDDPYFEVAKEMAILDQELLPNADMIIFLQLTEPQWRQLLSTRNRKMDQEAEFLKSFSSQSEFLNAATSFAGESGARLVLHEQQFGCPRDTAKALYKKLKQAGLLNHPD